MQTIGKLAEFRDFFARNKAVILVLQGYVAQEVGGGGGFPEIMGTHQKLFLFGADDMAIFKNIIALDSSAVRTLIRVQFRTPIRMRFRTPIRVYPKAENYDK